MPLNFKVREEVQDTQIQRDPFAEARKKQDMVTVPASAQGFNVQNNPFEKPEVPVAEESSPLSISKLNQRTTDVSIDKLDKMTRKLNVNMENIGMNSVGKAQLMFRLRGMLGENFMQNKDVQKLLSEFDLLLGKRNNFDKKAEIKSTENAKKTLDQIFKGNV